MITSRDLALPIPSEIKAVGRRKPRLLVVGFDGITFDVIDPLVRAGQLPTMAGLIKNGVSSRLYCQPPTNSVAGWTSFATGTNIGKHGIYAFETMVPSTGEFVGTDARLRARPPFWTLLSEAGKKAIVINVLATYPPDPIDGVVISGFPVPPDARAFTHPPELTPALRALGYSAPFGKVIKDEQAFHRHMDEVAHLASYLMGTVDWDCFVVVFTEPDKFGHVFIDDDEALARLYMKLDLILADLISQAGEPIHTLVCSDHGRIETSRSFYLERWLHQESLLVLKPEAELRRLVTLRTWHERSAKGLAKYYKYRAFKAYQTAKRRIGLPKISFDESVSEWVRWEERVMKYDPIDWKRTRVHRSRADGGKSNNCGLRINQLYLDRIMDSDGEYETLRADVIRRLESVVDPDTGEPFVERAFRREELYHGTMLRRLPDIIIRLRDGYKVPKYSWDVDSIRDPRIVEASPHDTCHHPEGVFMLSGAGVRGNVQVRLRLEDLAPIILYLLDVDIPSYMDGSVPVDAFDPAFLQARPVRIVESDRDIFGGGEFDFVRASSLDAEIEVELRKLGYK